MSASRRERTNVGALRPPPGPCNRVTRRRKSPCAVGDLRLRYAARMTIDPELDYLEKLFGDAYRKEIDQEENVWRSLPFFAATLALQLAGLAQIRDWVGDARGWLFWVALALLLSAALATLAALVFLAQSI